MSGLILRGRAARTDRARAGYVMWGLWLVVNGLVFSFMSGIIHSYYAVVLAPAIAALVGAGVVELWGLRERVPVRRPRPGGRDRGQCPVELAAPRAVAGLRARPGVVIVIVA